MRLFLFFAKNKGELLKMANYISMNWYNRQLKIAKRAWTNEELAKIKKLLEEGYNFNQITSLLNVGKGVIRNLNKKYNWKDLDVEKRKKDKMIADLYLLPPYGMGLSTSQIAKKYKFSYKRIKQALERLNLIKHLRDKSETASLKYKNNPQFREDASILQKQRFLDNPGLKDNMSRKLKQRYIDDPNLREEQSKKIKQFYDDNPEARKEKSVRSKQVFKDNTELRDQISKKMIQQWKDWGGLEGRLTSFPTRSQAEQFLNNFLHNIINREEGASSKAYFIQTKYMKIINDHTYPDEVQQGAIV